MRVALVLLLLVAAPAAGDVAEALEYLEQHRDELPSMAYGMEAVAQTGVDIADDWWPTWTDCLASATGYNAQVRLLHALATSGYGPDHLPGLMDCVRSRFDGQQTGDPDTINDDVWALLALRAAAVPLDDPQIAAAVDEILAAQRLDGGWSYQRALLGDSDTDMTGMALVALRAADALPATADDARDFLDRTQDAGGHRSGEDTGAVNAQSTVWAVHGYHALGDAVPPDRIAYLEQLQNSDGGFPTSAGYASSAFVTAEVVPVLAGAYQPWRPWADADVTAPSSTWRHTPVPMRVEGPFQDATWRLPSGDAMGLAANATFAALGSHAVHLFASGDAVHRARFTIDVENRLPAVAAPATTVHRIAPFSHAWHATDPDGDPVQVRWSLGGISGVGDMHVSLTELGTYRLSATVDDSHETTSSAWTLRVVNMLPRYGAVDVPSEVVADEPFGVAIEAWDPDGPQPTVHWVAGDGLLGAAGNLTLPAGSHTISIRIADADGGLVILEAQVEAVAPRPSAEEAPDNTAPEPAMVQEVAQRQEPVESTPTPTPSEVPKATQAPASDTQEAPMLALPLLVVALAAARFRR